MNIRINYLRLENFRRQRRYELTLNGRSGSVFGRNEAGKTTLGDAWAWLLTGKDAAGRADAEIKTLTQDGEALHNLDHSVEASLLVGDTSLLLKRTLKEKWTKRRGSATAEFSGHETLFEIDGVPSSEKAFGEKIAALVPTYLLPVLSSPSYFPSKMHWQDRRRLLLEVCGDLTPEQVLAAAPDLSPLRETLGGRSVEDLRAILAAQVKKINAELALLPARIDEANRASASNEDPERLEEDIAAADGALRNAQQAEADAKAGGGISGLRIKLQEAENAILQHGARQREKLAAATASARAAKSAALTDVDDAEGAIRRYQREESVLLASAKNAEFNLQSKRNAWEQFSASQPPVAKAPRACPTCGRNLAAKDVAEANAKAEADFNRIKAERLATIQVEADDIKASAKQVETDIAFATDKIRDWDEKLSAARAKLEKAEAEIIVSEGSIPADDGSLVRLQKAAEKLSVQVADAGNANAEAVSDARSLTETARLSLSGLLARKASVDASEQAKARVTELGSRQKQLAAEYEKAQGMIFLCEKFVTTKVDQLEERINSRFHHARFKMFNRLINGGIEECCDVTYQGVPFPDLNGAAKTNIGLDIIRTMSSHFKVSLPIFVDSRESVTKLIDCAPAQIVSLIVSPQDEKLRTELEAA